MKYINKKSVVMGLSIISLSLFSGCTLDDITGDSTWIPKEYVNQDSEMGSEDIQKNGEIEKMEIQDIGKVAPSIDSDEISEEAFAKAFANYIEKNPVDFGKKVDKAYQIYQAKQKEEATKETEKKAESIRDISKTDHVKGAENPKFVLFEYSDYHCPYCKQFHPTTSQFLKDNDDLALVFRAYPAVHKNTSGKLHELAECIAREDGNDSFWKFTNLAFEKGTELSLKNAETEMKKIGISNIDNIMKCSKNGDFKTFINESEKEAQSLGINGTPGSILKNLETGEIRVISGAYPLEALQSFKDELSK